MADEQPSPVLLELLEKKQKQQRSAESWLPVQVIVGTLVGFWGGLTYVTQKSQHLATQIFSAAARSKGVSPEDLFQKTVSKEVARDVEMLANQMAAESAEFVAHTKNVPYTVALAAAAGAGLTAMAHSYNAMRTQTQIKDALDQSASWVDRAAEIGSTLEPERG